jgi:hypothetical protein
MIQHILLVITLCCITSTCFADVTGDLLKLSDNHRVKVVWSRGSGAEFGFAERYTTVHCLMKFDTKTGKEDTVCYANADSLKSNVTRPTISHDGQKIMFTNVVDSSVWIINWDGSDKHRIAHGVAGCLWYDTASGKEYALYAKNANLECLAPVWRVNINDTTDTKEVLPKSVIASTPNQVINPIWLGVSKDGKSMVCGIGWPQIAMYSLETLKPVNGAGGCWPSVPYDNSNRLVVFVLSHDGFNVYPAGASTSTYLGPTCPWNNKPCGENQLNFPKMSSNHKQFMSVIDSRTESSGQGPGSIMVFKFDTTLTTFLGSAVVTTSKRDGFSDVWIDSIVDSTKISEGSVINKSRGALVPAASINISNGKLREAVFTLPEAAIVEIAVFSLSGQSIMNIKGQYSAGMHRLPLSLANHQTSMTCLSYIKVNGIIIKNLTLPVFN